MNDNSFVLIFSILAVVFALAITLALAAYRVEMKKRLIDQRDGRLVGDGLSATVGFTGGTAAFMLGVLMLAAVDHFNETTGVANQEAIAYAAAFDSTVAISEPARSGVQRDLVCLMRSVVEDSWAATAAGDLTGDENTHAWRQRAVADIDAMGSSNAMHEKAISAIDQEVRDATKAGQSRLLAGELHLPIMLWVMLYINLFVVVFSITLMVRPYPAILGIMLSMVFLVVAGMLGTLNAFAQPFTADDGVFIAPDALRSVMIRLEDAYPGPIWNPCERLAISEFG